MNKFSLNNPIFREKRQLNFAGGVESTEVVSKTPEQKVLDLLEKIHKVSPLVKGATNVAKVLKNNPYANQLTPIAEKVYGKKYTIDLTKVKDGKYILVAGSEKIEIQGLAFAATQWPSINEKLTGFFKGKNISNKLLLTGIQKDSAPVKALILAIVADPGFNDPKVIDRAVKALDRMRATLAPKKTVKARVRMKGKVERARVKALILPTDPPMKKKQFLEHVGDRKTNPNKKIDKLKMNIYREGKQINVQKWDHATEAGLSKIYKDFYDLGLPVQSPFYKSMFAILNRATNQKYNKHLATDKYRQWFQDPAKYMTDIQGLPDCKDSSGKIIFSPATFAEAYQHLQYVQGLALAQDKWQKLTQGKQEALGSNSIARKITDGLKANYNKLADAVRTGDYATAGMYAVIGWALWKSAKESGWFGKDGKGTKYLAYAIAAGGVVLLAKNAGYDVLKMAGFRDRNYEVKGTPLEAIDNILKANPQHRELAKDLDYGVVIQASDIPLRDLEEEFQKSNKAGGIQFIHPNQFPKIFPNLAKEWPFKMGIGEEALGGDYAGMNKAKLSANQREYVRVGQQLYKVALAMRAVYNDTLRKDHPNYKGKSYEKMLTDPAINPGKVRHLMAAVYDYAPSRPKRSLTSTKAIDEAHGHLREAFKDSGTGFFLEKQIGKSGHFHGKLMNYPVVFIRVGNSYRVYLKSDYKGAHAPGEDYIAEIPIQGGAQQKVEVKKAIKGVRRRLIELMAPLQGAGGKSLLDSSLKYENGEWTCEVNLPGAKAFDIATRKTKATITPYPEGDGVVVRTEGGVVVNLDELVAKQYPIGLALIPNVIAQEEFHALRFFYGARQVTIEDVDAKKREFTLRVGRNKLPMKLKYDKTTKKFSFVNPADEKKLLESSTFARDYIFAIDKNPDYQLNKTIEKVKLAIKTSPENFFPYVWEKITGSGLDPQMAGINLSVFSGSVPDYLSNTVVDVTKYEALQRLRRSVKGAKGFKDLQKVTLHTLHDVNARMNNVYDTLIRENQNIPSWKRSEYMLKILTPLRNASGKSNSYRAMKGDFELSTYKQLGFFKSDLSVAPHATAARLMKVYAYYTAHLDNHDFKNPITGAVEKIDLDNMASPPTPQLPAGSNIPAYKDPGLRGWYILRYFKYVQQTSLTRAKGRKMKNLPDGSQKGFWKIDEFEKWAQTQGRPTPLDTLDNMPPYKHKPVYRAAPNNKERAPKFTALEKAIAKEFDDAVATLKRTYGHTHLKFAEVDNYLRKKAGPGVKPHQLGQFVVRTVGTPGKNAAPIWNWAEPISLYKRRSVQMKAIHDLVEEKLIKYIFQRPKRFFKKPISLKARLLRKWPGLSDIPLVPGWLNPLAP